MPSCATCVRRKLECDALRPRCSPCRRSHIKCAYDPSPPTFEFRDETEHIVADSSGSRKKRKKSQRAARLGFPQNQQTASSRNEDGRLLLDPAFPYQDCSAMPWMDGMFDSYLDPPWELTPQSSFSGLFGPSSVTNGSVNHDHAPWGENTASPTAEDRASSTSLHHPSPGSTSVISDHVLAQHYTRNLTSRYSSKNSGWNYHTYFFNRFNSSHPFVMSSLYAWTSAHLFCAGTLNSQQNALVHYEKCLAGLNHAFNIEVRAQPGCSHDLDWMTSNVRGDDFDAISVTLFFLAWTDLILSRSAEFRNLLDLEADILQRKGLDGFDSIFIKIATWFCFLDPHSSAFGAGHDRILQSLGGETGLIRVLQTSQDFLQKEYTLLYPREEQRRDQSHLPLYIVTCRLVAVLGRILRSYHDIRDPLASLETRASLEELKKTLDSKTEREAIDENVASIYFTTKTLYHAVEICFSRADRPSDPLYSADNHAVAIITTTDRFYRVLNRPQSEPPPTKIWPLPLVLAALEARDSIYRGWAMQKIKSHAHAGKHYQNAYAFAEKVQASEGQHNRRADLAAVTESMGEEFII